MATRRQLPILNQKMAPPAGVGPGIDGEIEDRPPWHWSGIGALLVFTLWLPLAMVAQWVSGRLVGSLVPGGSPQEVEAFLEASAGALRWGVRAATVGPAVLAFGAACVAGGGLVGRFGQQAGAKEAAVSGVAAATVAWALATAQMGLGATWVLWPPLALLGAGFAYGGGRWGLAKRPGSGSGVRG